MLLAIIQENTFFLSLLIDLFQNFILKNSTIEVKNKFQTSLILTKSSMNFQFHDSITVCKRRITNNRNHYNYDNILKYWLNCSNKYPIKISKMLCDAFIIKIPMW